MKMAEVLGLTLIPLADGKPGRWWETIHSEESWRSSNDYRCERTTPILPATRCLTWLKSVKQKALSWHLSKRSAHMQNKTSTKGMGRKYTRSGGGKSKHQYGLAVDVVPIVNGEAQWDNLALWKIGVVGERLGLRWGGRWRQFVWSRSLWMDRWPEYRSAFRWLQALHQRKMTCTHAWKKTWKFFANTGRNGKLRKAAEGASARK